MNDADSANKSAERMATKPYRLEADYLVGVGYFFYDTLDPSQPPALFLGVPRTERNNQLADSIAHLMNEMQNNMKEEAGDGSVQEV